MQNTFYSRLGWDGFTSFTHVGDCSLPATTTRDSKYDLKHQFMVFIAAIVGLIHLLKFENQGRPTPDFVAIRTKSRGLQSSLYLRH